MGRLLRVLPGGRHVRIAVFLIALVAPVAVPSTPADAALRAGVATWDEPARTGQCNINHHIIELATRVFLWECDVTFTAQAGRCTMVHPVTLWITSCYTTLHVQFSTPATKTNRGWICPGFDTTAEASFYDGIGGPTLVSTATVTVGTGQADIDDYGEQTIVAESAATYKGHYLNLNNNLMANYFGGFTLECSRLYTSEGRDFKGELVLDQAP